MLDKHALFGIMHYKRFVISENHRILSGKRISVLCHFLCILSILLVNTCFWTVVL